MKTKPRKKPKPNIVETSKERRFVGLDMTVHHASFGVPEDAIMHVVFERIEMIRGADGMQYVTTKTERGRSVSLTKIGDVALARTYVASLNALLKLHAKELGLDE